MRGITHESEKELEAYGGPRAWLIGRHVHGRDDRSLFKRVPVGAMGQEWWRVRPWPGSAARLPGD
jgi:hypothetical protein